MGKKTKLSIVAFVIFVIGGIIMFSLNQKREQTEAQQIRHEQERMALYLVNHYEGVKKIEFKDYNHDNITGYISSEAQVNDQYSITFFSAGVKGSISIDYYDDFKLKKTKNNLNLNNIEIIYYKKGD